MNKFNRKTRDFKKVKKDKLKDKNRLTNETEKQSKSVVAVSGARTGKNQKKQERRWRKVQKEVLERGLVTMEDIEMISKDEGGSALPAGSRAEKKSPGFKVGKARVKAIRRGAAGGRSTPAGGGAHATEGVQAMVE